jgi:hypothetical protein
MEITSGWKISSAQKTAREFHPRMKGKTGKPGKENGLFFSFRANARRPERAQGVMPKQTTCLAGNGQKPRALFRAANRLRNGFRPPRSYARLILRNARASRR